MPSAISHQNSGWMYSQLAISVQLLMEHGLVDLHRRSIAVTDNGCSTTILTYGEHAEEVKLIDSSH